MKKSTLNFDGHIPKKDTNKIYINKCLGTSHTNNTKIKISFFLVKKLFNFIFCITNECDKKKHFPKNDKLQNLFLF